MEYLDAAGFSSLWITILVDTEEHTSASEWASAWDLDPRYILRDDTSQWHDEAIIGASSNVYIVHTSNMLIWQRQRGWFYQKRHFEWYALDYLPWASEQQGAMISDD